MSGALYDISLQEPAGGTELYLHSATAGVGPGTGKLTNTGLTDAYPGTDANADQLMDENIGTAQDFSSTATNGSGAAAGSGRIGRWVSPSLDAQTIPAGSWALALAGLGALGTEQLGGATLALWRSGYSGSSGGAITAGLTGNAFTATTSLTVTIPTFTPGDVMVVAVTCRAAQAPAGEPSGWTLIDAFGGTLSAEAHQRVAYRVLQSGDESFPPIWTIGGAGGASAVYAIFSGVDQVAPINAHGGQWNSLASTNITAPSITPTVDGCMLVGCFGTRAPNAVITADNRMTDTGWGDTTSASSSSDMGYETQATAGATGTRVASSTVSDDNVGILLALKPASTSLPAEVVGYIVDTPATAPVHTLTSGELAYSLPFSGASVTALLGDRLVLEIWGKVGSGVGSYARAFYDGTTEKDNTSNAASLVAPVVLTFAATTTPISGTDANGSTVESVTVTATLTFVDANGSVVELAVPVALVSGTDTGGDTETGRVSLVSSDTGSSADVSTLTASIVGTDAGTDAETATPRVFATATDAGTDAEAATPNAVLSVSDVNGATTEAVQVAQAFGSTDTNGGVVENTSSIAALSGTEGGTIAETASEVTSTSGTDSGGDAETVTVKDLSTATDANAPSTEAGVVKALESSADTNGSTTEVGTATAPGAPAGNDSGGAVEAATSLAKLTATDSPHGTDQGVLGAYITSPDGSGSSVEAATAVARLVATELGTELDTENLRVVVLSPDTGAAIIEAAKIGLIGADSGVGNIEAQSVLYMITDSDNGYAIESQVLIVHGRVIRPDAAWELLGVKMEDAVLTAVEEQPATLLAASNPPAANLTGASTGPREVRITKSALAAYLTRVRDDG